MKSGQFYRGKIGGIQKNFESPNLDILLPVDKIRELADYTEIGEYPRFFKQERVLTKTVVEAAKNTDGRSGGVTNHTILYQWDRKLVHEGAIYTFDVEAFISEILAGKRRLRMPQLPILPENDLDFSIIDPPPPIEWEMKQ
jgi:hypothetical protein